MAWRFSYSLTTRWPNGRTFGGRRAASSFSHYVEIWARCTIYLVHVSGARMIASGIDGVSRGDYNAVVMMGQPLLKFVPLQESALERAPDALEWVSSWARDESGLSDLMLVSPNQWPEVHTTGGTHLWFPPPAGAPAAVNWLVQSIHKRPISTHLFVCPRIMTAWWFKILNKASDIVLNCTRGPSLAG